MFQRLLLGLLCSDRHAQLLTTSFSITFYRQQDTLRASPTSGSQLQSSRPRNTRREALLADAITSLNGKLHCMSRFTLPWRADLSTEGWARPALTQFLSERAARKHGSSTAQRQYKVTAGSRLGPELGAPVRPLLFMNNLTFGKLSLKLSEPQSLKL